MFNKAQPFDEALRELRERIPTGSPFDSRQWAQVGADIRSRAFFSANVESTRFLQRAKDLIDRYMDRQIEVVVDADGVERPALRVGSRADFVRQMREFMVAEGMATPEEFKGKQGNIKQLSSLSRLQLIFDTNIAQAEGFARWKQGQTPIILDAYPAARFVRHAGARVKRRRHQENENVVKLKNDHAWWALYQNGQDIGGFEVPYPPYGYNSHMDYVDVSRKEATKLGLLKKNEPVTEERRRFNDGLKASIDKLDPELRKRLKKRLKRDKTVKVEETPKTLTVKSQGQTGDNLRTLDNLKKKIELSAKEIDRKEKILKRKEKAQLDDRREFVRQANKKIGAGEATNEEHKELIAESKRKLADLQDTRRKLATLGVDAISLPTEQRGKVRLLNRSKPKEGTDKATGIDIIERLVHADFMPRIKFKSSSERAFHVDRKDHGEVSIRDDGGANVVAHEIMHQIERRHFYKEARAFLLARGAGEEPKQLSKLTGQQAYGSNEVALEDNWKALGGSHYTGRFYPEGHGATEILTTGIERLARNPARFLREDPEFFDFIISLIQKL